MSLKLTITSFQRLSPGQETTKILDRGSLTIGRAAQNNWILQDPERILSSNHCVVHYRDGGYFLTDTSTNGTFLNDSDQRIPRNQTVPLGDGDRFVLGDYEIEVSLIPGAAELAEIEPEGPLTDIVPTPPVSPVVGGVRPASSPAVLGKPSFADLLAEEQEHLGLRPPAGRPGQGGVVTEPPPDLLTPDRAFFEPPEVIPGTPPIPSVALPESIPAEIIPLAPSHAEVLIPEIPDFAAAPAGPPSAESAAGAIPAIPDLATAPAGAAEPAAPAEAVIPEDWWLTPSPAPVVELPAIKAAPPSPPAEPVRIETPPKPPIPQRPVPVPPAPAVVEPPPAPAVPEPAGLHAEALIQAFLEGAGLRGARLTEEQWPEIMANLGAIFRETVQGLTDILRARGDVKGEFRLDRTAIGPIENNPLKTPPGRPPLGPEEIMTLLLIRQKEAYMSPVQAVREGFKDIKDHQVAVWAGVQAALNRLLDRFDPHNLETRLQQTVLDSILPASRKAKYWDLFTTEYQTIAREAEDDFNELFGDEFARAYEERLRARC